MLFLFSLGLGAQISSNSTHGREDSIGVWLRVHQDQDTGLVWGAEKRCEYVSSKD